MYNDIDDIIAKKAELQKAINRKEKEISILGKMSFIRKRTKLSALHPSASSNMPTPDWGSWTAHSLAGNFTGN